ncbi:hypothetical protein IEO21_05253 [Rhodonia placenta]|uniref:HORMA domain-containing protein n=1 Tax=Rhodonia placenta TaxID=104341 RepID=A0A8H7P2I6_9APHY|nr:hypothetical protein IEO21_05253 [Postia placenta]
MSDDPTLTFNLLTVEVAIHTILYVRQIYPADLFVRRKKYDTPVYQSRHPALNEYISGAIKAIEEELLLGHVDKVVVVIKNKEDIALERFIFAVKTMIEVELFDKDTRLPSLFYSVEGAMTSRSLAQYFRSFLVKLNMIEAQLGQLEMGDELSFAIVLELQDTKAPAVSHDEDPPPWIPAPSQHATASVSESAELHMIRAVDTGIINLSLVVQESAEKLKTHREDDTQGKGKGLHCQNLPEVVPMTSLYYLPITSNERQS